MKLRPRWPLTLLLLGFLLLGSRVVWTLDTGVRRNEIENIQAKLLTDKPKM